MEDFQISGGGTLYLLHPMSESAKQWVDEHLPKDALTLGEAVAVEHRYISNIVDGILEDGLTVSDGWMEG
jgi:hypothetical protein